MQLAAEFLGHVLTGNHHDLWMDFTISQATGTASRLAVPELLDGVRALGHRPHTLVTGRGG